MKLTNFYAVQLQEHPHGYSVLIDQFDTGTLGTKLCYLYKRQCFGLTNHTNLCVLQLHETVLVDVESECKRIEYYCKCELGSSEEQRSIQVHQSKIWALRLHLNQRLIQILRPCTFVHKLNKFISWYASCILVLNSVSNCILLHCTLIYKNEFGGNHGPDYNYHKSMTCTQLKYVDANI